MATETLTRENLQRHARKNFTLWEEILNEVDPVCWSDLQRPFSGSQFTFTSSKIQHNFEINCNDPVDPSIFVQILNVSKTDLS